MSCGYLGHTFLLFFLRGLYQSKESDENGGLWDCGLSLGMMQRTSKISVHSGRGVRVLHHVLFALLSLYGFLLMWIGE